MKCFFICENWNTSKLVWNGCVNSSEMFPWELESLCIYKGIRLVTKWFFVILKLEDFYVGSKRIGFKSLEMYGWNGYILILKRFFFISLGNGIFLSLYGMDMLQISQNGSLSLGKLEAHCACTKYPSSQGQNGSQTHKM